MRRCTKRNSRLTKRFFDEHKREFDNLYIILKDMEMKGAPKEVCQMVFDKAFHAMRTGEEFEMFFAMGNGWKEIDPSDVRFAA